MHLTAIFCNVYLLECRVNCGPRDNTPLKLLGLITLLIHSSCLNYARDYEVWIVKANPGGEI